MTNQDYDNSNASGTFVERDDDAAVVTQDGNTGHDPQIGAAIGAVGGAIVGGLAGGPIGAVIGAVVGGVASDAAVAGLDRHDNDGSPGETTYDNTGVSAADAGGAGSFDAVVDTDRNTVNYPGNQGYMGPIGASTPDYDASTGVTRSEHEVGDINATDHISLGNDNEIIDDATAIGGYRTVTNREIS